MPETCPLTTNNVHKIQAGHPEDHRQRGDVACSEMPRCGIDARDEGDERGSEEFGVCEAHGGVMVVDGRGW